MNLNLQSLRGLCALVIFLHHACAVTAFSSDAADMTIAVFFMLSGLTLSMANDGRHISLRPFMRRRLAHLYPLYIVCQFVALAVFPIAGVAAILKFGVSLGMAQTWWYMPYMALIGNPVAWFASSLMLIYFFYPFMHNALLRHPRRFSAAAATAFAIYFAAVPLVPESKAYFYIYVWPLSRMFDFVLGMLLWEAIKVLRAKKMTAGDGAIALSAVLTAIFLVVGPCIEQNFRYASWWWLPAAALILSLALSDDSGAKTTRLLHSRITVEFGNISFSFYMVHMIVIHTLDKWLGGAWLIAAAFVASTAAAYALQRWFVGPLNLRLR